MKFGFSIQDMALLNEQHPDKKALLAGYEELSDFLQFLKSNQIDSIEIRKLGREFDPEVTKDAIQMIWDMGMQITIHGDVTGDFSGKHFVDIYPSMEYILENYQKYQRKLMMPIHAYQAKSGDAVQFKRDTIALMEEWAKIIERDQIELYFALENNRNKQGKIDPGNSTYGVMDMVKAIDHPHVGITWDMGHYYSNLTVESGSKARFPYHLKDLPADAFLEKVYHTHIHGLNTKGTTHFPLTEEISLPLEEYVQSLKSKGYNEVLNLELSLLRWDKEVSPTGEIEATIGRLRDGAN